MTLEHNPLAAPQAIPSSAGALYANPSGKKTYVRGFKLHNTNSTSETVALYHVPNNSGTVGTATVVPHRFLSVTILANETVILVEPTCLILNGTNDSIQGVTTTASKVNFWIYGDRE